MLSYLLINNSNCVFRAFNKVTYELALLSLSYSPETVKFINIYILTHNQKCFWTFGFGFST